MYQFQFIEIDNSGKIVVWFHRGKDESKYLLSFHQIILSLLIMIQMNFVQFTDNLDLIIEWEHFQFVFS